MSHSVNSFSHFKLITTNKYFLVTLALFLIPISGLSVDIFVPSLPAMTQYFGVHKAMAQFAITAYMIGLSAMQFFAGGISDSYGRKKPFLFAMSFYILSSLLIPATHHIEYLLFLRFIQGVTVAIIIVSLRAVVSDLFEGKEFYKMVNYMTMVWSIGPIIAPAIGGYLQFYFGWHISFYLLAAYSLIGFILISIYMPETSVHQHPFHLKKIFLRYKEILSHRDYLLGVFINSTLYSFIIIFAVISPFLVQTVLHYTSVESGYVALLTGLAWFAGNMTNRFLGYIALPTKAKYCFGSMLMVAFIALMVDCLMPLNLFNLVIPVIILFWLGGIVFPNYFAQGVALFPKTTGSANALFGGVVSSVAGVLSVLGALLNSTNAISIMLVYFIMIGLCLILVLKQAKKKQVNC